MPDPTATRRVQVRDEYAPKFGRQVLTLWSGTFASDFDGTAVELPNRDGYMVNFPPHKMRVPCESPRTDENYERVDAAIQAAVDNARLNVSTP